MNNQYINMKEYTPPDLGKPIWRMTLDDFREILKDNPSKLTVDFINLYLQMSKDARSCHEFKDILVQEFPEMFI